MTLYALIDPEKEVQNLKKREALARLVTLRASINEAIDRLEHELFLSSPSNGPVRKVRDQD